MFIVVFITVSTFFNPASSFPKLAGILNSHALPSSSQYLQLTSPDHLRRDVDTSRPEHTEQKVVVP